MSDTTFVNGVTLTDADWFNDVNRLHYTIFGDPTTKGDARGSLGVTSIGESKNIALSASVGSNALTIALKGKDGNDPSSTNVVSVAFRNVTATTGDFAVIDVTAATSLTISSGSTLGTRDGIPSRIWVVGFNDGGTFRLGAINCITTAAGSGAGSDVSAIYPLSAWGIASSTAEGGAGAADSAQVFYTGTAVTSKAYAVLGYVTFESGQATAGTWASSPSRVQLFGPGVPLPGQCIQEQISASGATAAGSTTVPLDDTIPQNNEGDQYFSQAITPNSAANVLEVVSRVNVALTASTWTIVSLFQDSTANALSTGWSFIGGADQGTQVTLEVLMLSSTTSSTTFKVRAGPQAAATMRLNGTAGARYFGGVMRSFLRVREIMG